MYPEADRLPPNLRGRIAGQVRVFSGIRDKDSSADERAPARAVITKGNKNTGKSSNLLLEIMGMIQKRGVFCYWLCVQTPAGRVIDSKQMSSCGVPEADG